MGLNWRVLRAEANTQATKQLRTAKGVKPIAKVAKGQRTGKGQMRNADQN